MEKEKKNGRKFTDDGLPIYTPEELKIGLKGSGRTPKCPFDCDCCFWYEFVFTSSLNILVGIVNLIWKVLWCWINIKISYFIIIGNIRYRKYKTLLFLNR